MLEVLKRIRLLYAVEAYKILLLIKKNSIAMVLEVDPQRKHSVIEDSSRHNIGVLELEIVLHLSLHIFVSFIQ